MTTLPDPGFAGDTGDDEPRLRAALSVYAVDGAENPVLAVLADARLLVAVVTSTQGEPVDGPVQKEGEVSAVLMRGLDGRVALLAFTSTDAMRRWNAGARPVPVTGTTAAAAAVADGARALLVDVAGPVTLVVETAELAELAAGHRLRETDLGWAWFAVG